MSNYSRLQNRIDYFFKDISLLETALTHSSYANEHSCDSYERLEFLGDSILGFNAALRLYGSPDRIPEGMMTKVRAELVCETALYEVSRRLELGSMMRFGKGMNMSGSRMQVSALADAVESLIAAIYLDGGLEKAVSFIDSFVLPDISKGISVRRDDYKTELQELLQKDGAVAIKYQELSESGPDHDKTFVFSVSVDENVLGTGTGKTKKAAEQEAARAALEYLKHAG